MHAPKEQDRPPCRWGGGDRRLPFGHCMAAYGVTSACAAGSPRSPTTPNWTDRAGELG